MVGEASGRMQKADCRDEIALPAAMLAWLKYRKQRTRNSRKRFLVFFCSLFVKARVVYRLHFLRDRRGDLDEMPERNRRYVMQSSWKQGLVHHFFSEVKAK